MTCPRWPKPAAQSSTPATPYGPVTATTVCSTLVRPTNLPPDQLARWMWATETYALFRLDDGTLVCTEGLCTHGLAHLAEGVVLDCLVECPKHNGRFDLRTGEAVRHPATTPLALYPVQIRNGRVVSSLQSRIGGGRIMSPVRIGVLGCGRIGRMHAELISPAGSRRRGCRGIRRSRRRRGDPG